MDPTLLTKFVVRYDMVIAVTTIVIAVLCYEVALSIVHPKPHRTERIWRP